MIGKYAAKVDEKGRLFVPAKLRAELGDTFFVTSGCTGQLPCLTIYTRDSWEKLLSDYETMDYDQQADTMGLLFSNAVECVPDKQYRFLLAPHLFQYAGIDRDVVIAARGKQADIWDAGTYAEYERERLNPAALMAALRRR